MQSCKTPITQDPIIPFFDSGGNTFFPWITNFLSPPSALQPHFFSATIAPW